TASARSWPAQNALPAPVIQKARIPSSRMALSSSDCRASAISRLKLLNFSGRFKVRKATPASILLSITDMIEQLISDKGKESAGKIQYHLAFRPCFSACRCARLRYPHPKRADFTKWLYLYGCEQFKRSPVGF